MGFFSNLARKLVYLLITLFLVSSSTFFMLRLLPGSPFSQDRMLAPEIVQNLEAKYGLNKPVASQYVSYMKGLLKGDLGPSLKYPNRDVNDILFQALPVSLSLGFIALVLATLLGILFGVLAALYPNKLIGIIPSAFATLGMSVPSFLLAAVLVGIFGLYLNILPVALWEGPAYVVLPAITLSIAPMAYITRITRASLMEVLSKEHVRLALAKGLNYTDVLFKHSLRNALGPIVTILGPLAAILITGSFVVEYIFALPGMGKYFVTAFINRDYFLVSGVVLIFAVILLVINILIDLIMPYLEPKTKS